MSTPRAFKLIRIVVSPLVAGLILTGVVTGLWQQRQGLAEQSIDCEFRIKILRERLLDNMERSNLSARNETALANLLRETQTACADRDPEFKRKLDVIQRIDEASKAWRLRSAEARAELRAL